MFLMHSNNVRYLLALFSFIIYLGLTPVHVATKEASIEVLKYLFQIGANKNASVRNDHSSKCR